MEVSAPVEFLTPLVVPNKLLLGPGPSNFPDRVREALSHPVLGHLHPETLKIMDDLKEGFKYLFQTTNPLTLCISASGHAGMETGLVNLLEKDDVILIAHSGIWGERAADMSKRIGGDVRLIKKPLGEQLSLLEARKHFELHKPKVFFITHGESSTGMLQNLDGFGELCHEYNCIFMVDAVITLGCVPFYADKWKIDVAYSGSQKVLNAPPGITPITFNSRAIDKITSRKTLVQSFNFDMHLLGEYWNCFPNKKRIYHHTVSPTLLYGLRESLAMFIEQGGLEASWKKHAMISQNLYKKLEANGLSLFIRNANERAPSITSVNVPANIDGTKVSSYIMQNYKVEISGGLGPTVGKIFRIGLMGTNARDEFVDKAINLLIEAIEAVKSQKL
ncbi:CLUMA_CG014194, isoform A [Clunio marinus]|uniref:Alanine--glyoxylate aminotransferase n=1 Tax=Clunio marinus TaxID=568069 RepID=A0A1J1IQD4_9DIPT|nr:CLUMA_CG014194, isoform A [Clunio marinus]